MKLKAWHLFLIVLLVALLPQASQAACRTMDYKGKGYALCEVAAGDDLRLWHSDENGNLLGGFAQLNKTLAKSGRKLDFAMNAGMFHSDRRPVGLYIEDGRQITPLADGGNFGNFGLKPNGVFCFDKDHFSVIETGQFQRLGPACRFATQSGPMLVINGKLHPRFLVDATSRYIRNGVGVSEDGLRAVFVISNDPVTFHEFGSLFRDKLKLPNALYLDGNISRLFARDLGRADGGFLPLGPIVGTTIPDP